MKQGKGEPVEIRGLKKSSFFGDDAMVLENTQVIHKQIRERTDQPSRVSNNKNIIDNVDIQKLVFDMWTANN